jgi:hypothetical protein
MAAREAPSSEAPLIRRQSPSKDGRLSTPFGATFSRKREKGLAAASGVRDD